uniref:Uncharacterized protein n=1 Tax=Knipowitschia caucasica TaxID=637954 RepID=A0AAV2LBK0_KNICA
MYPPQTSSASASVTEDVTGWIEENLKVFLPPPDNYPQSRSAVSPLPSPYMVLAKNCFHLRGADGLPRMIFRARPYSHAPWSSELLPVPGFASATARPRARLACRLTASLTAGVHHRYRGLPPGTTPEDLQPQLRAAASAIEANMVHSDSMSPSSRRDLGGKTLPRCEWKVRP